jgi:hypothetical protein
VLTGDDSDRRTSVILAPAMFRSPEESQRALEAFARSMHATLLPIEGPAGAVLAGLQATTSSFEASDGRGNTTRARFVTLFSPHGTSLSVLGSTPGDLAPLKQTVDAIAATVTVAPPTANMSAIQALRGTWTSYDGQYLYGPNDTSSSRSYEESISFYGVSAFRWEARASISVSSGGEGGVTTWRDAGSYTIVAHDLVLRAATGQVVARIALFSNGFVADGKRYARQ